VVLTPTVVPVRKELMVLPGVCVGCQLCELACSLTHEGIINPYLSRIKVTQIREEGILEPTICHHCNPAPCEQSCPTKALFWASNLPGVVLFDEGKCTSCYNCVHACPFGAIQIGPRGQVLKCDLCGGNPACVSVCQDRPEFHPPHWPGGKVSALGFVEAEEATRIKRLLALRSPQR
jgi:Fe-S-cluster-containing hydrogenase component 2